MVRLPAPARYTPWTRGVYDVAPALRPFGTDFGNGEQDSRLFQLDTDLDRYLSNKRVALRERRGKYARAFRMSRDVEAAVIDLIVTRLSLEWPELYADGWEGDARVLESSDGRRWVLPATGRETQCPAIDLLARMVPEDLAIVRTQDRADWVAYLHLCAPSHWAAEEKIGRSFFDVHAPIPGFERVNRASSGLVDGMIHKGPFVRFVWTIESDDRLNHHPEPPPGEDPSEWEGRDFREGRFWVRTERQVTWGLPGVGASLFAIRVGFVPDRVVMADDSLRKSLISAIESMSIEALSYKGIAKSREQLLRTLEGSS